MVEDFNTADGVAVKLVCKTLDVSRSGLYDWTNRPESNRDKEICEILAHVISIHEASRETYSSPWVTAQLRSEGHLVNEKRIAKLMHDKDIASVINPRFKVQTTDSNHDRPVAPRLFESEFADAFMAPDQVYVGDITCIQTDEGFLILAVFMDMFTRKIVGHSIDETKATELILSALAMSLGRQNVVRDHFIAHGDRGSQHASEKFSNHLDNLDNLGIVASTSRKGSGWENVHVESFFHTLKQNCSIARNLKPENMQNGPSSIGSRLGTTQVVRVRFFGGRSFLGSECIRNDLRLLATVSTVSIHLGDRALHLDRRSCRASQATSDSRLRASVLRR